MLQVPTIIQASGFSYPGADGGEALKAFELTLFELQRVFEDKIRHLAAVNRSITNRPAVVVLDRCLIDIKTYVPADIWDWLVATCDCSEADVFGRYDMALHLVTTAEGAEHCYTLANNLTRKESPQVARELDYRLRGSYKPMGDRWHLIPNPPGGFSAKIEMVTSIAIREALKTWEAECTPLLPPPPPSSNSSTLL